MKRRNMVLILFVVSKWRKQRRHYTRELQTHHRKERLCCDAEHRPLPGQWKHRPSNISIHAAIECVHTRSPCVSGFDLRVRDITIKLMITYWWCEDQSTNILICGITFYWWNDKKERGPSTAVIHARTQRENEKPKYCWSWAEIRTRTSQ